MADVKWIKITTDIFDDEKILLIESLPDSYAIITVWFKLLCLAGKQNNSGVFMMGQIAYTDKMLATIFRMKEATVTMALQTFEQFCMIEIIDGVITIPNWGKHQNLEQIEARKEYQREYQREYRKKQKQIASSDSKCLCEHLHEQNVNTLEEDKEEEKEKKEKKKKEKEVYFVDDVLNDAFLDYIEFRKKIKAPLTDRAKQLAINKLKELAGIPFSESMDNDLAVKILEQSVMNGWKGLFPLKDEKRKEASGQSDRVSMWQDIMEGLEDE